MKTVSSRLSNIQRAEFSTSDGHPVLPGFTYRQCLILDLLCRGYTDADMAEVLDRTPRTVTHLVMECRNILGASNRAQAAALWTRLRLR